VSTPRPAERALALLAIVACLALLSRVVDVGLKVLPNLVMAPPPPVDEADRDAELVVKVERGVAGGAPVAGADVRVFWERDGRFYDAGRGRTGPDGRARIDKLPRGVVWVLAEGPDLARRSTQIVLDGGPREVAVALPEASTLRVTVSDEEGKLLPRATVLVTGGDPLPFGALTGFEGVAVFTRLGPPPWTVKGSAPGYESVTQSGITGDVTLALRRLGSIAVRVEMPNGKPAVGAEVLIAGSSLWPARRAETDSNGVTRIAGLLAGSYDLRASLGSLVSDTLFGYQLERGADESVTLKLAPGRMVTALVTDDDQEHPTPVGDADVVLAEGGLSSFPLRGRTVGDGTVSLGPLPAGPATLSASAEGFVTNPAVAVPDELDGPVRISLLRGGTLEGEVVDAKGNPVDGASIEVIGTDLGGLPVADTPMLMAFRRSHFEWALPGPRPLIPAGELGVMPGPIPPIPRGSGILPDDTGTLPADQEPVETSEPWVTRLDGTFQAKPVTPGRIRALVRHPAFVEGVSDAVSLAPGGTAKVKVVLLAGGSLEGKVIDPSGSPVAGARVDLTAVHGTLERTTLTASDGTFAFAAVPDEVILSVARPENLSKLVVKRNVEVPEGGKANVEITLPGPREAVEVAVVDDSGRPVDAAQVTFLSLDPSAPLRQTVFTGDQGTVSVGDARGLDLRLIVEAPGWSLVTRSIEKAPERIEIKLVRGVIVTGRVTAVRGRQNLEGAAVTLVGEGRRAMTFTDKEGSYRLRDVAPGPVHISVSHPDFATAELSTRVEDTGRADRPFEVSTIDLPESGSIQGEVVDAQGKPVSGARVGIGIVPAYLPAGALPVGLTTTDSKGHFELSGLSPGKLDVEAYAPDRGRGAVHAVQVSSGRPTTDVKIKLTAPAGDDDPAVTGSVAVTLGERGSGDELDVVVVHVAERSEAERAGIVPGDVIVAVDGVDVASMYDARARLSGKPGSDVVVELWRNGGSVKLRVAREQVRR